MDWIEIAVMVLSGAVTVSLPWFIWVTKMIFTLQSDLRSNNEKDQTVMELIKALDTKVDNISNKLNQIEVDIAGIKATNK